MLNHNRLNTDYNLNVNTNKILDIPEMKLVDANSDSIYGHHWVRDMTEL